MFGFITGLTTLSSVNMLNAVLLNTTQFKCISVTNPECKLRPQIVNVNSDEPVFYPFSIKTRKCVGGCNKINHPYVKILML